MGQLLVMKAAEIRMKAARITIVKGAGKVNNECGGEYNNNGGGKYNNEGGGKY